MIQLNIDCEGPITQNDNAFELCRALIPGGGDFFARVSKYDDFLADVERRSGYKAGDTLKLVLPFLKAFGATNAKMGEFAERTLVLLPGARQMLPAVAGMLPTFIISTSYRPYLDALCVVSGFPPDNIYCTAVDIDRYSLSSNEARRLEKLVREIAAQPLLSWPDEARSRDDLSPDNREIVERLDAIFWDEISRMSIGRIFSEVNPVGGLEKARAVEDSLRRTGASLSDVLYVGDSITDVQALELVREGGGIAVSFNGNSYAVRAAQWAVLSGNTSIVGAIAQLLKKKGMNALDGLVDSVGKKGRLEGAPLIDAFASNRVDPAFVEPLASLAGDEVARIQRIEGSDIPALITESEHLRKNVRGIAAGELG